MPFKKIIRELVDSTPGATGAIFVDWEGEAVDQFTLDNDAHHIKVVGAHKGVILSLINDVGKATDDSRVDSVIMRMENYGVIMAPVKDGYFVAMTLKPDTSFSRARFGMEKAVEALRKEM